MFFFKDKDSFRSALIIFFSCCFFILSVSWFLFVWNNRELSESKPETDIVTSEKSSKLSSNLGNRRIHKFRLWLIKQLEEQVSNVKKDKLLPFSSFVDDKEIQEKFSPIVDSDGLKNKKINKNFTKVGLEPVCNVKLYFYNEMDKQMHLARFCRKLDTTDDIDHLQQTFKILFKGPSQYEKEKYSAIHSLTDDNALLDVWEKDHTIFLNFKTSPLQNSSLEILRYQLAQLLHTALEFKKVKRIQIQVRKQPILLAGLEQLMLPEYIELGKWPLEDLDYKVRSIN